MFNEILDKIKSNPSYIYYIFCIIGIIYTFFRFAFKLLKNSKLCNLFKLITDVPQTIIHIKEGQKNIYSEIKLQSKVISSILDTLELAQFLCDPEGKCIKVNSKWISLTGLSEEEALGHNWLLSIHQNDRDRVHEKWSDMVDNHSPFEEIFRYQHRVTGTITKVKCRATDVIDENNQRLFILGLSKVV